MKLVLNLQSRCKLRKYNSNHKKHLQERFIMKEQQKAENGYLYNPNGDEELIIKRLRCVDLCYEFNNCKPSDIQKQKSLLKQIFGSIKDDAVITAPFHCDYGFNITAGKNFYTNYNVTILDCAKVTFGENVFIAPNCVFSTAGHAIDPKQRACGLEIALPIIVGNNVWIGANVTVLPSIKIGDNSIIGAGSVVTKDIPSNVIAVGNPCKVLREITSADKEKYPIFRETPAQECSYDFSDLPQETKDAIAEYEQAKKDGSIENWEDVHSLFERMGYKHDS